MNEIEDFLKRAAAMRARQQGGPPAPPAPAPAQRPAPIAAPLAPLARRPISSSIVQDAEVIDAEEITEGADVAEHVALHLSNRAFTERASHLGEGIKSADEFIESHLHQTFEHKLGNLGATTSRADDSTLDQDENEAAKAAAASTSAPRMLDLLRSPQSLRNAIILTEILNPPRW